MEGLDADIDAPFTSMRTLTHRSRRIIGTLVLAGAAALLPASSAGAAATFPTACTNSLLAGSLSDLNITMGATATPNPVAPNGSVTLGSISQSGAIPASVFLTGYIALGTPDAGFVITPGENSFPISVETFVEGANTTQGTQLTNSVPTTVSTTISDPDNSVPLGNGPTGDESATPGAFNVSYADQTWTAGGSPGTIDFRMDTRHNTATPPLPNASNRGMRITADVGGLVVTFSCSPGTSVNGMSAGGINYVDPAPSFASTQIEATNPKCKKLQKQLKKAKKAKNKKKVKKIRKKMRKLGC
jgi:hypothetical protein